MTPSPSPDASAQLRLTVYAALFAALMAAGAFMIIPIGPVPIVLQNMFVFLAGLVLGVRGGLAAVAVYLLAGALGLPVFAGGSGGLGRFIGPTGGYLLGYLPAVVLIGWVANAGARHVVRDVLAMLGGALLVYGCGVLWLKIVTAMSWGQTLAIGLIPFVPGDLLKIAAAAPLARLLRNIVYINRR